MRFTFLHAADLHLGSPFRGLSLRDEALSRRLAGASREAFVELIDRALEEKIAFAIFAGDIFDGDWRDASIALFFNRQISRLAKADVPIFLLKGNHDADSVVTKSVVPPDLARQFPTGREGTFELPELRVALHGRGFSHRAESENLARALPPPKSGWFNIGVLHTSLDGRPGHTPYAPCTLDDLRAKNYDYWALGHVHAHEVVARDPYVVFPGNLQGRNIRETGPKGAVLVDVADGQVRDLRRLIVDRARFAEIALDAAGHDDAASLLRAVEARAGGEVREAEGRPLALRIRIFGASPLHVQFAADPARWRDEIEAAAQRAHEDVAIERLLFETGAPPSAPRFDREFDFAALLDACLADPGLREAALAALGTIEAKIPAPGLSLGDDLDALLREARDLALARAEGGGS
ncbi:DNA repair exonuclease [Rhodoblastus acidophilus]|uniref:DNA repair exonuclease n=1 Tax=Candidatus Rhodoblastus alkanivorans TaxID=2954117 RepID=A0ABS9Z3A2_9HYPH|nr:DNA repair exonuclease [Candidatus Rhodoblastus alkanivorans]MCI4677353.1 DNA repair exonuclease [Candidatus Rhodoblastus alkanivorans]MCI4682088.1 DNA repair exonuclease [Candidatus Rhodoblastus alkanivorans]MDI4639390.1 DNA repair exonuclease [Rhodoblastus acidophilus]